MADVKSWELSLLFAVCARPEDRRWSMPQMLLASEALQISQAKGAQKVGQPCPTIASVLRIVSPRSLVYLL